MTKLINNGFILRNIHISLEMKSVQHELRNELSKLCVLSLVLITGLFRPILGFRDHFGFIN